MNLAPWGGVAMLLSLVLLNLWCKTPLWTLLLGVSSAFAGIAWVCGVFDLPILAAMPSRVLGLLDNDLLQALPLYVLVGFLMSELGIAQAIFHSIARWRGAGGAARPLAALALGACVGPMNGSVASSSALLGGLLSTRVQYMGSARAVSLISAAATIGVVVPPSLVLLLLGDAMMRAHTEAMQLPGLVSEQTRIINTQDVFHAALLPALLLVLCWALLLWCLTRDERPPQEPPLAGASRVALVTILGICALLAGVFTGTLLAVEAAATAAMLMVAWAVLGQHPSRTHWAKLLSETLQLSGALMALLVGATVFSLVLRLYGTDRWLGQLMLSSPLPAHVTAALVLVLVGACALAMDAFEMVFVVVPLVAPPLIQMLGDAQQVAVLFLFTLQMSFLLPPLGYAVMIARARSPHTVSGGQLLRAVAPYVACQLLVLLVVFFEPAVVHGLDNKMTTPPTLTQDQVEDALEGLARGGRTSKP
jgi:TRAP-type mannitol/chloroaromatic compound transport system permease large subunit